MGGEAIDEQAKEPEDVGESAAAGHEPQSPDRQPKEPPLPPEWKSWLVVAVLVGIYLNSFLDRQIMGLLVEDIKASLGASDTQMGLLTGIAFAFFYATAGLPIGYLVDRKKRTWIIIIGQLFWTLASFSCGLAGKFWQLFIFRFGVGVGEATLSPSAYSIIADSFYPKKIALALGIYGMGVTLGGNIANLLGAWAVGLMEPGVLYDVGILGERYRWQIVFFMICLPTIPLTLLMLFVKEPFRRSVKRIQALDGTWEIAKPPRGELQRYLKKNWKTVLCHNVGFAWLAFSGYGVGMWLPAFYMRLHGLTATQAGLLIGTVGLIFSTSGTVFGGWLADKMYAKGYQDAKIRIGVGVSLAWIPAGLAYPLVSNIYWAGALMVFPFFIGAMTIGVQAAAVQEMMPNTLRGRASAIFLFFNSLIGLGLGPLAVGMSTDYLFQDEMRVNHSIVLVGVGAHLMAATILFIGMKHYRKTLDELPAWIENQGN